MGGVEQGYGVCVLRIVGGRVNVVQGILCIRLGAVLGEEEGLVVLELVARGLQEERYWMLVLQQLAACTNVERTG